MIMLSVTVQVFSCISSKFHHYSVAGRVLFHSRFYTYACLDHCLNRFPSTVNLQGNGRGERNVIITRLFPNMKFGCFGTVVQVTAAVVDDRGQESPRIQFWRENDTQSGLYHKISTSDILVRKSNPPCYRNSLNNGIFQCTLREDLRISVQPGEFLGLEIPVY
jgi:hypothetical protein